MQMIGRLIGAKPEQKSERTRYFMGRYVIEFIEKIGQAPDLASRASNTSPKLSISSP